MEANGEVNNGINYLPTSANGNNHNNNNNNNNNIEELRRWKMAALEVALNIPLGQWHCLIEELMNMFYGHFEIRDFEEIS
jgi:hypothetical protein